MKYKLTYLWRYNPVTGFWVMVRDSLIENADRWLEIFQGDEPDAHFKLSKTRPTKPPPPAKRQTA